MITEQEKIKEVKEQPQIISDAISDSLYYREDLD